MTTVSGASQQDQLVLTAKDLQRKNELSAMLAGLEQEMAPKMEEIENGIKAMTVWDSIELMIEFKGNNRLKFTDIKYNDQEYEVTIKRK